MIEGYAGARATPSRGADGKIPTQRSVADPSSGLRPAACGPKLRSTVAKRTRRPAQPRPTRAAKPVEAAPAPPPRRTWVALAAIGVVAGAVVVAIVLHRGTAAEPAPAPPPKPTVSVPV